MRWSWADLLDTPAWVVDVLIAQLQQEAAEQESQRRH